ncbi:MAG: beta-glucosidase BglX [Clostridia bacterium]|nr:beta-glucosidase BglX [Clostridia bacterium]
MVDISKLISEMTTEEKIGQLVQYNANLFIDSEAGITGPLTDAGLTPEDIGRIGSVLNFKNAEEVCKIQDMHLAADRNKIPMVFMMDVIHGYRTIFPIPLGLGCSFDTELVKECTRMASDEASAAGIQVTFTPMVDYVRDARWGRVMETCGEEPLLNGLMGAAQVEAFRGEGIEKPGNLATCVKHYAAYGGAEAGRDYNTVELSEHTLREFYLPAYKACIDAGVDMLMPSFNSLNGVPSVANNWLMNDILRDEWGFDGLVISDYNAIGELITHGVAADIKEAAEKAFNCGCHIEMCSSGYVKHLAELVDEGKVSAEKLDEAVYKVLELKARLGLFEDPYHGASPEAEAAHSLTPTNRAVAKKAAMESAVLLKNENILPFKKEVRKVALIGPFADNHEIIGFWSCQGKNEESVSVKEGVAALLPDAEIVVAKGCSNKWNELDASGIAEAVAAAEAADAVILCLGEPQNYSGEGNCRTDIDLPGIQNQLAEEVAKANSNTAAIIFTGRPLVLSKLNACIPAILNMWFPGTEGGSAAAALLFGDANPCGKLSMSFPKSVGQCPIYYNHTNTGRPKPNEDRHYGYNSNYIDCGNLPLFSFGHGLSYSNFVYEDMTLSSDSLTADGSLEVKITVLNDSAVEGKETVQLYMRDMVASNVRPVQQLIAFNKISLAPGERKTITFTIKEEMLRFWNNENKYVSEPGEFRLSTGCADHLIKTQSVILK